MEAGWDDYFGSGAMMADEFHETTVSIEDVIIPTYGVDKPTRNPMFLDKRVYQGSSGAVYPHSIIERVFDEKCDKSYKAIYLENRYLKIMLLPELGGRVQMALDKTNGYHFIYYNEVIKPALVGLTGPWISGGIEFNWPQHHRPSTFQPVDYAISHNDDGSKTVWFSEIERMYRTKGMVGFTLYPDRAYLELKVQLYNRTSLPQTFLWWANPAVHVNDDYQSVFPPDVYAVMDHGKRDVSSFPVATGTYYKVDYAPGTDISRYRNIPVPTSFMAYHSDFDFIGCYDHGQQAGMMHVANHHLVPGKKQWTWGNGDFGRAWDRQLTDTNGPYIELMCGAFTDNQPDFSWLKPGEEKHFTQVFMPYKGIGAAKNASKDAVVNLEVDNDCASIGVYISKPALVRIVLQNEHHVLLERQLALSPLEIFTERVPLAPVTQACEVTLQVFEDDRLLVEYTPVHGVPSEIPSPATPALPPEEIASNEELFLNGLHLEQYRHATYAPEPYYEEALRRDPFDSRCNNAMGLLLLRRGKFSEAEAYFRRAVERLTRRNPNPYESEAHYNLGLCLQAQGRFDAAENAFYKAVWDSAWKSPGYFELAKIACRQQHFVEALALCEQALIGNWHHHKARHLKTIVLRRLGRMSEALAEAHYSLSIDPLDFGAQVELSWLGETSDYQAAMGANPHNYIEIALDYAHAGQFDEAAALLEEAPLTDPMAKYYQGWIWQQAGDIDAASASFAVARDLPRDYSFPHRIECVPALQAAMKHNPRDAHAAYALGNFWYAHQRYAEAVDSWELSSRLDSNYPTVRRNLGLACASKYDALHKALDCYTKAFALDVSDGRVFFELDQLYKRLNEPPESRLARLEAYRGLVDTRDDLTIEYVSLLNLVGRAEEALDILMSRTFHPWEGGEGKVTGQYVTSLLELTRYSLANGQPERAIDHLTRAQTYPHNLGEGKLAGAQESHIHYFFGLAYATCGRDEDAKVCFERAAAGSSELGTQRYYNDQPPDMAFYQGLASAQLGLQEQANGIFGRLIAYGEAHQNDHITFDYFAVSLPEFLVFEDDLRKRNEVHCQYMMALGYLGLKDVAKAAAYFDAVLALASCHMGAVVHRRMLNEVGRHADAPHIGVEKDA
jgi:tetratricopeptide (TPR) repeat protein